MIEKNSILRTTRGTGKNILLPSETRVFHSIWFKNVSDQQEQETLFEFKTDSKENLFYAKHVNSDFETAFHISFVDELLDCHNVFSSFSSDEDFRNLRSRLKENWLISYDCLPIAVLFKPKNYAAENKLKWKPTFYNQISDKYEEKQLCVILTGLKYDVHVENIDHKETVVLDFNLKEMLNIIKECLAKENLTK